MSIGKWQFWPLILKERYLKTPGFEKGAEH